MVRWRIIDITWCFGSRRVLGCRVDIRNRLLALLCVTATSQYSLGAAKVYIIRDTRMTIAGVEGRSIRWMIIPSNLGVNRVEAGPKGFFSVGGSLMADKLT